MVPPSIGGGADESPELYFEIQHLNQYGRESLQALRGAVERIWQSVAAGVSRLISGLRALVTS